jgi:hypothetical protein
MRVKPDVVLRVQTDTPVYCMAQQHDDAVVIQEAGSTVYTRPASP